MQSNTLDTYWRLPTHSNTPKPSLQARLKSAGYKSISKFSTTKLIELNHRIDRGFLCYDTCKKPELVKFATARGIEHAGKGRFALIEALEEADRNIMFEKIVDLPAELRNRVYEQYLAEFGEELDCPSQPPLARANRQMRGEVLPLFYGEKIFTMDMKVRMDFADHRNVFNLMLPMRAYAFTNSLGTKYTAEWMKCVKYYVVFEEEKDGLPVFKLAMSKDGAWSLILLQEGSEDT